MENIKIKVLTEFSRTPSTRKIKEGNISGELFRQTILLPKFKAAFTNGVKCIVDLDGTSGCGTSFLEEAFGGLIRIEKIPYNDIKKCLEIISNEEPIYKTEIEQYLLDAHNEES